MGLLTWLACVAPETPTVGVAAEQGAPSAQPGVELVEPGLRFVPRVVAEEPNLPVERPDPPPDPTGFLFAHDVVHEIRITLDDDAEDALGQDQPEDVPAAVTYAGATWHDVGLQLKGTSSFRPLGQKASFKIDFGEFVDGQTMFGVRRLTLNNMIQDGSMLRERCAYRLYAAMGTPASRQAYARVWVNDEPYGVYSLVETPDRQLMERIWGDGVDGNLYEGGGGADFWRGREGWFELREAGSLPPHEEIRELVREIDDANGDEEMLALIEERFDEDALLAYLAVDLASGNPDGYAWNRHNFLAFHGNANGGWRLLPWGQDRSFGHDDPMFSTASFLGRMTIECLRSEPCEELLRARIEAVVETWEEPAFLQDLHDAADLIAEACAADTMREDPCEPEELFAFLEIRAASVRSQLD